MNWRTYRFWRFAISRARRELICDGGVFWVIWDEAGRWVHLVGPLWWLSLESGSGGGPGEVMP